ncbi:SDR family NAD(P)-dependent oxidoreductase [Spiribacter vilamensis]|uniref:NADP-dependent 3-hydroxy acid dehydrogenase YdfG n=1 Tax=Spiribacter vilamensis TaxID=531306 RepID=A0A4Q8CZX5_9GAMM|nr:SDR family NAD(P)-dependent oxidoreductase [Spiribacter vilamensis]RZU98542.1 NADP-dependent 3-hydroxy acid dehydrogenase YdfG [Spiribacter vilamensis]TVO60199.1 SDR family NAD(P)-dependent oxidoreductase [Spiribacter vilamensis]
MSDLITIITGAGTGIGRALALRYAEQSRAVLAIGRRSEPLEALAAENPAIHACAADVSTDEGQTAIEGAVGESGVEALIHNAGVLAPVGPLLDQSADDIRQHLAINLEAPIALSRRLRPMMDTDARILHISSGAAHRALPGWGAYCISKAALYMAYEVLHQELAESSISVGSLRPGVVDTPMQSLIRSQSVEDFPAVENFRALKENDALTSPENVARFIDAVLKLPADRFSAGEWDIREHWDAVVDG